MLKHRFDRYINKIEDVYGRSRVSVKVERGSTFTFTLGLSYIASISFMHVKIYVRSHGKIRDSANQPLLKRARRKKQSNTKRERRAQCARPPKGKVTSYRFYTCLYLFSYLILTFLFCQPGFHAPYRHLVF